MWRAELEKRKLLMLHEDQKPRLGAEHATCPIGKCGIKRCLMWDSLMNVDVQDGASQLLEKSRLLADSLLVTVKMHIQPSLLRDLVLPPFTLSFHVSYLPRMEPESDRMTSYTFIPTISRDHRSCALLNSSVQSFPGSLAVSKRVRK